MRMALVTALLAVFIATDAEARRSRPRTPTALDDSTWTVKSIDGRPIAGRIASIGFHSNGRVQLHTACSVFMAGDFSVSIWGLRTQRLDPPHPRLPCADVELAEERALNNALAGLRRYKFESNRRRLILKASDGTELIAER